MDGVYYENSKVAGSGVDGMHTFRRLRGVAGRHMTLASFYARARQLRVSRYRAAAMLNCRHCGVTASNGPPCEGRKSK